MSIIWFAEELLVVDFGEPLISVCKEGVGNVVCHTIIHFVKGHNKESKGLLYD